MLICIDHSDAFNELRTSLRTQLAAKLGIAPSDHQLDDICRNAMQAVIMLDTEIGGYDAERDLIEHAKEWHANPSHGNAIALHTAIAELPDPTPLLAGTVRR